MKPDEARSHIRNRVETFIGEANATEGLPDPDPETIDGVTHALFVARGDTLHVTDDDVYLAALAFQYGMRKGARDAVAKLEAEKEAEARREPTRTPEGCINGEEDDS